jgi:trehalose 6-phosphate synthase
VLVLSRRAGAAEQLRTAVLVDPLDVDGCALALGRALRMPQEEQEARMRHLRANVAHFSATRWARQMLQDAVRARGTTGRIETGALPVPGQLSA